MTLLALFLVCIILQKIVVSLKILTHFLGLSPWHSLFKCKININLYKFNNIIFTFLLGYYVFAQFIYHLYFCFLKIIMNICIDMLLITIMPILIYL